MFQLVTEALLGSAPMKHTILLKVWMSLSGLYLIIFLVVHLLGNLQLFLPTETARIWFNGYSAVLTKNPLIKVAGVLTYLSVLIHALTSWLLTKRNRSARAYAAEAANASSSWYSRRMGVLGLLLLVFLVFHMWDFWVPYQFGPIDLDVDGRKDLYAVVLASFSRPWVVAGYMLCMVALGYHLQHGFTAAFRSLGVHGARGGRILRGSAPLLAWIIAGGFAVMPLFTFLRS
ncbi:MAG: succinate dehydrogenase [Myxococcota bacterium]